MPQRRIVGWRHARTASLPRGLWAAVAAGLLAGWTVPVSAWSLTLARDDDPMAPADPMTPAEPATPTTPAAPATPASAPGAAPGDSPLSGPRLSAESVRRSILAREADGKVRRLDMHPAEAAVLILALDPAERAAVDRVLLDRAKQFDAVVRDHLKLIVDLQGARQVENRAELRRLLIEAQRVTQPIRDQGPLETQLAAVVAPEKGRELVAIVKEYTDAVEAEDAQNPPPRGMPNGPAAQRQRRALNDMGLEIRRAYERVVGQRVADFDALLAKLDLTPEQDGQIRKIAMDSFTNGYGKATPAERARVFRAIYNILSPQQRTTLQQVMREQSGQAG